jgi:hypothetical protein
MPQNRMDRFQPVHSSPRAFNVFAGDEWAGIMAFYLELNKSIFSLFSLIDRDGCKTKDARSVPIFPGNPIIRAY